MDRLTLNILGTTYTVHVETEETDQTLKRCAGYCDPTAHEIVIEGRPAQKEDLIKDYTAFQHRVLRHEILHAFLFESGLGGDATYKQDDETHPELMVDWFARQAPKIYEAYGAAGVI